MIEIDFAAQLPDDAGTVAYLVPKDGVSAASLPGVGEEAVKLTRQGAALNRFEGEAGGVAESAAMIGGKARRVLLVGVGEASELDYEKAGAAISARLIRSGETHAAVDLSGLAIKPSPSAAARLAQGAALRSWRYDSYRTKLPEKQKASLKTLTVIGFDGATWQAGKAVAQGVALTRELVTEPPNIIYAESFVQRVRERAHGTGLEFEVLGQKEMEAAGMGALLGVNQGSIREPRLLVMKWDGSGGTQPTPVVFIGKGVTFDTGGISLKPGAGMEDMKWDMGGAGAVAGAMLALAGRRAKAHVVGICGLVENMPDAKAQRPGDVVTSMSGQTIEVINTDAEGRLVLCDAMTWAQQRFSPKVMVDLATLTGAMIVALGHEHGGLFANDDELANQLLAAGSAAGDPLWRLPLGAAYDKLIDSQIADIKNVGPREGGSITAAQFLKRFVDEGVKWAHLDIAGMVWAAKPGAVWDKGATGYGVRLLDRFVADNFEG